MTRWRFAHGDQGPDCDDSIITELSKECGSRPWCIRRPVFIEDINLYGLPWGVFPGTSNRTPLEDGGERRGTGGLRCPGDDKRFRTSLDRRDSLSERFPTVRSGSLYESSSGPKGHGTPAEDRGVCPEDLRVRSSGTSPPLEGGPDTG